MDPLTNRLILLPFPVVSKNVPVSKAVFYESKVAAHPGSRDCRRLCGPGGNVEKHQKTRGRNLPGGFVVCQHQRWSIDLRERIIQFVQEGGFKSRGRPPLPSGPQFGLSLSGSRPARRPRPQEKLGPLAQTQPPTTSSPRPEASFGHTQGTTTGVRRQPPSDLGAPAPDRLHAENNS